MVKLVKLAKRKLERRVLNETMVPSKVIVRKVRKEPVFPVTVCLQISIDLKVVIRIVDKAVHDEVEDVVVGSVIG